MVKMLNSDQTSTISIIMLLNILFSVFLILETFYRKLDMLYNGKRKTNPQFKMIWKQNMMLIHGGGILFIIVEIIILFLFMFNWV